jgi:mannose-6-phosphate isomerase-like protein (cupin superfamily)
MRRIVTGLNQESRGTIAMDGAAPRVARFDTRPGFELTLLWSTDALTQPATGGDPTLTAWPWVPRAGGTRFGICQLPPLGPPIDGGAFLREVAAKAPGLAGDRDPAEPGMHATPTIDYLVVLSGEVVMEMEDGNTTVVRAGDCVVQNGTRHAWRNRGEVPCVMVYVMLGVASLRDG